MDLQKIINVLAGLVFAFLSWWSANIWASVQSGQTQISALTVELAKNYVPRAELQSQFERLFAKLDEIQKQGRQ